MMDYEGGDLLLVSAACLCRLSQGCVRRLGGDLNNGLAKWILFGLAAQFQ